MEETCGCKGIRTCCICEKIGKPTKQILCQNKYEYCYKCQKSWFESTESSKNNEKLNRVEFSTDKEEHHSTEFSNKKERLHSTYTKDLTNKAKPTNSPGDRLTDRAGLPSGDIGIKMKCCYGDVEVQPNCMTYSVPKITELDFLDNTKKIQNDHTTDIVSQCPDHIGPSIDFPGIHIYCDFVSEEEEMAICDKIYETPFTLSQSGRRKQDYGPKVNFKKRKLKVADFTGLPEYSKELYHKMKKMPILSDFQPVELCNLEYSSERGSSIDPHFDDFWLWGERLVTLNLLSDSVLYFTNEEKPGIEVNIPMLRRSLLVVYGPARHIWKHAVHRYDIINKRIAITFRELSDEFKYGGPNEFEGSKLLEIALTFKGQAVGTKTNIVDNSEP